MENVSYHRADVGFAAVNVPGSNNDLVPWTAPNADPTAIRPDRLVCVTARSEDELRGGVYQQPGPGLPKRVADASAKLNKTGRSLIIRLSQSALGRPKRILVAVETTAPGCDRIGCIDSTPNDGSTRPFRLR